MAQRIKLPRLLTTKLRVGYCPMCGIFSSLSKKEAIFQLVLWISISSTPKHVLVPMNVTVDFMDAAILVGATSLEGAMDSINYLRNWKFRMVWMWPFLILIKSSWVCGARTVWSTEGPTSLGLFIPHLQCLRLKRNHICIVQHRATSDNGQKFDISWKFLSAWREVLWRWKSQH